MKMHHKITFRFYDIFLLMALFKPVASSFEKKVADFYEQSS